MGQNRQTGSPRERKTGGNTRVFPELPSSRRKQETYSARRIDFRKKFLATAKEPPRQKPRARISYIYLTGRTGRREVVRLSCGDFNSRGVPVSAAEREKRELGALRWPTAAGFTASGPPARSPSPAKTTTDVRELIGEAARPAPRAGRGRRPNCTSPSRRRPSPGDPAGSARRQDGRGHRFPAGGVPRPLCRA